MATLKLIRSQGVNLTGDEPHYLAEAVAIGRFHTLNLNPAYNYAIQHGVIYPWTGHLGPHLATSIGQGSWHHGLFLPFHAIGFSALLAIPMLISTSAALNTMVVLLALLTVGLVFFVGEVSAIRSPWKLAVLGVFLSPALALAATQVYPDLITGLLIANIVMIIAVMEFRARCSRTRLVVVALMLVVLPWLDQKNIFYPMPLLAAFAFVYLRSGMKRSRLVIVIVPAVASLLGLLSLNLYAYGHLLGAAERIDLLAKVTVTRAIALLFDSRQGLFVQQPAALLGVAGLWASRKRIPIAVATGSFLVVATICGNATQPGSFGGYSFVGRFEWPTVPIVLPFAGLFLIELWLKRRVVAGVLTSVIGALYVVQEVPVSRAEHAFYNLQSWNPHTYIGWWGGLDPSPPIGFLGPPVLEGARLLWGLTCVALVCGTVLFCLVQLVRRRPRWPIPIIAPAIIGILISQSMTLSAAPLAATFPSPSAFVPLGLIRICDTRRGNPSHLQGPAAQCNAMSGGNALQAGGTLTFTVAGQFTVPQDVGLIAVLLDVTSLNSTAGGSFTLFPAGSAPPVPTNLDFAPGQAASNLVEVPVGAAGAVSLRTSATTDAVIDLEGYFTSRPTRGRGLYNGLDTPSRICDTRGSNPSDLSGGDTQCNPDTTQGSPDRPVGPTHPLTILVRGRSGVPEGASAAVLDVTVIDPRAPGFLTLSAAGQPQAAGSSLSYVGRQSRTNRAVVPLDSTGRVSVYASAPTDVVIDVSGAYTGLNATGSKFTTENVPIRICDTRGSNPSGLHRPENQCNTAGSGSPDRPLRPHSHRTLQVTGVGFVPAGATAVTLNVTTVGPAAPLDITLSRQGTPPRSFDVVAPSGGIGAELVTVNLTSSGTIDIRNDSANAEINLAVDVEGWYSRAP